MILEIIAIYGAVKGAQQFHEMAKDSDAAKSAINAVKTARAASRASHDRVRKIVDAGRKRAADKRESGIPWKAPRFGKVFAGGKPDWSHKNPSGYDQYRLKGDHPMARAWQAYHRAKTEDTPQAWTDFRNIFGRAKEDPRAGNAKRKGDRPAWDTPDDLYVQYAKARTNGKPVMDANKVAERLGIPLAEADQVMAEWRERYQRDSDLWRADREGARLIHVTRRQFATPAEAHAWTNGFRCEHCGGGGQVVDAPEDDGTWQFMAFHRAGCKGSQDPATYDTQTSGSDGEPVDTQDAGTEDEPGDTANTTGGNVNTNGNAPHYNTGSSTGSGAGNIPNADELFELLEKFIGAPFTRGLAEIIERYSVIASGITMLAKAGGPLKTHLDEYHVDAAIVTGTEAGFSGVNSGAATLTENAELAKAFYAGLAQAVKEAGGQIPSHELLNQDRQHA
jgi:hypothetical protein